MQIAHPHSMCVHRNHPHRPTRATRARKTVATKSQTKRIIWSHFSINSNSVEFIDGDEAQDGLRVGGRGLRAAVCVCMCAAVLAVGSPKNNSGKENKKIEKWFNVLWLTHRYYSRHTSNFSSPCKAGDGESCKMRKGEKKNENRMAKERWDRGHQPNFPIESMLGGRCWVNGYGLMLMPVYYP